MDIRNLGQSMMTRLRQLPAKATHLAENLPETLKDLPAKAQDVVQHLPEHLEEGAKSILANETVAQGWRTVGKGVGELIGHQPGDQISLTNPTAPVVKPPVSGGNAVLNPVAEIPAGTVAAPKPPVGNAIPNAATKVAKPKPVLTPKPGPVSVIKEPGFVSGGPTITEPAANIGNTVKRARTAKEAGRVASGVRNTVKPSLPVATAPVASAPVVAAPVKKAADVLKNGATVPVKVKNLDMVKQYASASKHITERAALLKEVGQPEAAAKMTELSARLSRAGELAKQGNTPAASRMLHAKFKVGLRNPGVQDAIRLANKADDLKAAFGTPATSQPFAAASEKMLARAKQLSEMGHPGEARTLTNFAKKLQTAGESYAAGDKSGALKLFRNGLTEKTQQALKVSDKADEVFAAFGKGKGAAKTATSATSTAKVAAESLKAEATQVAQEGAKSLTKVAKAAKGSVPAVEAGGVAVAQEATATVAKEVTAGTAKQVSTSARTATSATRVAKGASRAKDVASAASAGEATQAAAQTATKAAKAAKGGAQAVQAGGTAAKEVVKTAGTVAKDAVSATGGAAGTAKGMFGKLVDGAKNLFGKASERVKGLFGKIKTGAGNSAGWQTIKQGFKEMLPGLKKAAVSSAIFSAAFSTAENLFKMFKGERAPGRALGGVLGDTLGGTIGGVISSLASGGAIAALGALGVVGWPVTLAAGAVGILGFMAFDRFFRKSWVYDQITHLFT
ncbi:hypothetical protein J7643_07365 [bacterium]|nr:hypothetical protein [bacterium]